MNLALFCHGVLRFEPFKPSGVIQFFTDLGAGYFFSNQHSLHVLWQQTQHLIDAVFILKSTYITTRPTPRRV